MTSIPWNRINTGLLLLVLLAVIGLFASRAYGGPLDPPAGPPASTNGVRPPGTPISSIPFIITTPGNYYLTKDLTATLSSDNGININADDVTLELGGFALKGAPSSSGYGIEVGGIFRSVHIAHGTIAGWNIGVDDINSDGHFDDLTVRSNHIAMHVGSATVEDCTVEQNDTGISASLSTIRRCTVDGNNGSGLMLLGQTVVEDNIVTNNGVSIPGTFEIEVRGSQSVIKDNFVSGNATTPFIKIFPAVSGTLVIRNRFDCVAGIVDNSGLPNMNYYPFQNGFTDTNYCF